MRLFLTGFIMALLTGVLAAQNDYTHTQYIDGPFDTPQEVTEVCLLCHGEVGDHVMATRHWNWEGEAFEMEGHGEVRVGKKKLLNNFCIAVTSNEPRCTSCHIGYGWEDASFDFEDPTNIDCLVCHEQTGTYKKIPTGAGMPVDTLDLVKVAESVGMPTRRNCGVCHFDGGGGTGVKHGDLDDAMYEPDYELDVHMGGLDFQCVDCHGGENHKIIGASHGSMAQGINHFRCDDCHGDEPHEKSILNDHTASVACETCHITEIARGQATKVWWDWSKAGEDREPETDEYGKETYSKKKGEFTWKKNYKPDHFWYNGSADYYMQGDEIDPSEIVQLNSLNGDIRDPEAKIFPFKVMRGKQPYDAKNNILIVPNLFGPEGYWKTYDWVQASRIGMEAAGLPFSGGVGFIETEMYWPINHTVQPAGESVRCTTCHGMRGEFLDWEALGYPGDPLAKKGRKANGYIK